MNTFSTPPAWRSFAPRISLPFRVSVIFGLNLTAPFLNFELEDKWHWVAELGNEADLWTNPATKGEDGEDNARQTNDMQDPFQVMEGPITRERARRKEGEVLPRRENGESGKGSHSEILGITEVRIQSSGEMQKHSDLESEEPEKIG
nr:hypothetical protein Iba_chr09bCG10920 [Ipomoea batatas]